jgi:hypothetical protein
MVIAFKHRACEVTGLGPLPKGTAGAIEETPTTETEGKLMEETMGVQLKETTSGENGDNDVEEPKLPERSDVATERAPTKEAEAASVEETLGVELRERKSRDNNGGDEVDQAWPTCGNSKGVRTSPKFFEMELVVCSSKSIHKTKNITIAHDGNGKNGWGRIQCQ